MAVLDFTPTDETQGVSPNRSHPNVPDIDQSDRLVPINLRQSGPTPVQMLISTRVRKSPFRHISVEAGRWRATVHNRIDHPRGYVQPEDGGAMAEMFGDAVRSLPFYGLMRAKLAGVDVLVSQTGFTGEKGYEIYTMDSTIHAEAVWYAVRGAGASYGLRVIAPAHYRRVAAGILSWGRDMDFETSPFQVNLAYQVPRKKAADCIDRQELERQRAVIDAGEFPFKMRMVGIRLGSKPITDYANDFWLISEPEGYRVGYVTSPWWSPELQTNIALCWVPNRLSELGTRLTVEMPEAYCEMCGKPVAAVAVEVPSRPSVNPCARTGQGARPRLCLLNKRLEPSTASH